MNMGNDIIFLDAGLFIGALLKGDTRPDEAKPIVEEVRAGHLLAATTVRVLSEVYAALTWRKPNLHTVPKKLRK